jgi:hypothetical protein
MKLKSDISGVGEAVLYMVVGGTVTFTEGLDVAGTLLLQPAVLRNMNIRVKETAAKHLFFISILDIRLCQPEIARGRGDYLILFLSGDIRVIVLEAADLATHVSPVALIKDEQL